MNPLDKRVLTARIRAAADAGLISAVDRDIRLGNVERAGSDAELELIARELDQVNAPAVAAVATSGAQPRSRVGLIVTAALLLMALGVILVAGLGRSETGSSGGIEVFDGDGGWAGESDADDGWYDTVDFDFARLQEFVDAYESEFGSTEVRRVVLTTEDALVWVLDPDDGMEKWHYSEGWWRPMAALADPPARSRVFDLTDFDLDAVADRIAEAVEESVHQDPDSVSVTFRFLRADPEPLAIIDVQEDQTEPVVVTASGDRIVNPSILLE